MSQKPRPNDARYLEVLRSMTEAERLEKAFELSELSRELFRIGLRQQFPEKSEAELRALYLERLALCRNQSS
ncbi:MAG TPA: hypothetical protein VGJ26_13760 [Pirellulales bacterium]